MNMTNPWAVQIAMLPVRRPCPDDIRSADPAKRDNALAVASRRTAKAQDAIIEKLRTGPKGGMTAEQIRGDGRKAGGSVMRNLNAMAADGRIQKRKISAHLVKWRLTFQS